MDSSHAESEDNQEPKVGFLMPRKPFKFAGMSDYRTAGKVAWFDRRETLDPIEQWKREKGKKYDRSQRLLTTTSISFGSLSSSFFDTGKRVRAKKSRWKFWRKK